MKHLLFVLLLATCTAAQDAPNVTPPPQSDQRIRPFVTQLKKTVVVIKLVCQQGKTVYSASGTGFFVLLRDEKAQIATEYLVTNRHVAECWDKQQHPMKVKSVSIRGNLLDGSSKTVQLNSNGNAPWTLPSNESVDLAVLPLGSKTNELAYLNISTQSFATDDMFSNGWIHEGQSIIFTGFFPKFEGTQKTQPIVREGIISSLADEPIIMLKKGVRSRFYLGDVHALAGNSGSPVLVSTGGVQGSQIIARDSYQLIGVVSGYLIEDENMSLKLETTIETIAHANSGITTIVPVSELRDLLNDERLMKQRAGDNAKLMPPK